MGNFMTDWLLPGGQFYGAITSANAANEANQLSREQLDFIKYLQNLQMQYQIPGMQEQAGWRQALQPTLAQILGYASAYGGVEPGTTYNIPEYDNPAIPQYLRQYANAPADSLEGKVYRAALYNNLPESQVTDIFDDVNKRHETIDARLARRGQTVPTDWQTPSLRIGGGTGTVPTKEQMPSWLQVPQGESDYMRPFTPQEIAAFKEPGYWDINNKAGQMESALTSDAARRGIRGSSVSQSFIPYLQAWQEREQAQVNADVAREQVNRADRHEVYQENLDTNRRSEGANNFSTLLGMITGQEAGLRPYMDMSNYTNTAGNLASIFGNQAANWGAASGDAWAQLGAYLATLGKQKNPATNSTVVPNTTYNLNYSGQNNNPANWMYQPDLTNMRFG